MRELSTPPTISFGRPFRVLEEEAYPQVIPNDDDDDVDHMRMGYFLLEEHTKFYLDFGHDSFLMEGTYSLEPTGPFHIQLPSPPLLIRSNEINVTGPTSAAVLIHGPFFQEQVKETLVRMNEECSKAAGATLDLSIEVTDDCDINVGREIMGELLGIVNLCVGKVHLVVPENTPDASPPDTLTTSASFETPSLHSFSWKGDLEYIPSPWNSLSNIPLSQLTSLTLESDISVDDCTEILYRCQNAADFRVNSLKARGSFMKHTFHHSIGRITMGSLENLEILLPASCQSLVEKFSFTTLEHMNVPTSGKFLLDTDVASVLKRSTSNSNNAPPEDPEAVSFGMQNHREFIPSQATFSQL